MKISKDQETPGDQTKTAGDDHSSPAAQQPVTSHKAAGTGFWSRRKLIGAGLIGIAGSFVHGIRRSWGQALDNSWNALPHDAPVEYIVVGSGPGGGPLACNLARADTRLCCSKPVAMRAMRWRRCRSSQAPRPRMPQFAGTITSGTG